MRKRILLSLCIFILFCSSCKKKEEPLQEPDEILNYFNITPIEQSCIDSSKLIYNHRTEPKPLTEDQLKNISDQIRINGKQVNDVWFGHVLNPNSGVPRAVIYFKPTKSFGRIKKGNYYFQYSSTLLTDLAKDSEQPGHFKIPLNHSQPVKLLNYIYVAPSEQTENKSPIPSPQLTPFASPEGFTDQEIIEIVDFVRSGPDIKQNNEDGSYFLHSFDKVNTEVPILSIRKENGNIEVNTGSPEGPLDSTGQFLKIKKTDDGYELIAIGMWIS